MAAIEVKADVPVDVSWIVDGRTVVHELALEGDEHLRVGDHVALVADGISLLARLTEIDADGYLHLSLR